MPPLNFGKRMGSPTRLLIGVYKRSGFSFINQEAGYCFPIQPRLMLCLHVKQHRPDLDGCIAAIDVSGTATAFLMPMIMGTRRGAFLYVASGWMGAEICPRFSDHKNAQHELGV